MGKKVVLEWDKLLEVRYDKRESLFLYQRWILSDSGDVLHKCWASLLPFAGYLIKLWCGGSRLKYEDDLLSILSFELYRAIEEKEVPLGHEFFSYLKKFLYHTFADAVAEVDKGRKIPSQYRPFRFRDPVNGAEDKIFIKEIPSLLRKRVSESCRFSSSFKEASLHVINLILSGVTPSPRYVRNRWDVDSRLVIDWTLVQCRSALYEIRESLPGLLGKSEMEYFFDCSRTFHL